MLFLLDKMKQKEKHHPEKSSEMVDKATENGRRRERSASVASVPRMARHRGAEPIKTSPKDHHGLSPISMPSDFGFDLHSPTSPTNEEPTTRRGSEQAVDNWRLATQRQQRKMSVYAFEPGKPTKATSTHDDQEWDKFYEELSVRKTSKPILEPGSIRKKS